MSKQDNTQADLASSQKDLIKIYDIYIDKKYSCLTSVLIIYFWA